MTEKEKDQYTSMKQSNTLLEQSVAISKQRRFAGYTEQTIGRQLDIPSGISAWPWQTVGSHRRPDRYGEQFAA